MPALSPEGLWENPMHTNGHASMDWGVPVPRAIVVPYDINETKLQIIAAMGRLDGGRFDRSVSVAELYAVWDGSKRLSVFEYHLSTLVRAGIAEVISGPELRFRLAEALDVGADELFFREGCRSLAELQYG
jgi:hypothetical protein